MPELRLASGERKIFTSCVPTNRRGLNMQAQGQLTIRLLGAVEVRTADGRDVTPPGKKLRALLTCLALSNGKGWHRERLSALLWSDRDEEQARASLRQALAELRKLLGDPSPFKADRDTIDFNVAVAKVDVTEFQYLAAAGKLEQAASLYRGELMDGYIPSEAGFAAWLTTERTRLHDLLIHVLTKLANAQDSAGAIATVQRMLEIDPLNENSHRMLMRLYAAAGQRALALRQYQICRETLQNELDVAPDPETNLLLKRIQSSGTTTTIPVPRIIGQGAQSASADVTTLDWPPLRGVTARPRIRPWHLALAGVVLLLIGAAAFQFYPRTETRDGFPSLIVLPFSNLSNDPTLGAFAGGVTDDIITMASHFPDFGVVVLGKQSTSDEDPVELGRSLNADYVLIGSMQRKGKNLRVNAQLIDAHTSRHIWADGYEGDEPKSLQDKAVKKIIRSISGENGAIKQNEYERVKDKSPAELTEYDYYLKGHEIYSRFASIEEHDRAGAIWQEGLKRYPESSLLRVNLAWYHFKRPWEFETDRPAADQRKAGEYARAALAAPETSRMVQWLGHSMMGYIHWHEGDFINAVRDAERAVAINPHDAAAMSFLARIHIAAGNPERGIEWVQATMNPDSDLHRNTRILAWAYYVTGQHEKSIQAAELHIKLSRTFPAEAYLFIAASNVRLSRIPEAREAIATLLKEKPTWSLATERTWELDWPYKNKMILDRWLSDLAAAGLPALPFANTVSGYQRLTTEELKALTFGHTIRARDLDTGHTYVDTVASDGSVRTEGDFGPDTGVINHLKDGLICYRWTEWGSGCGSVFRKPSESPSSESTFVYIIACCRYEISVN
jgi:adenylate cyclase